MNDAGLFEKDAGRKPTEHARGGGTGARRGAAGGVGPYGCEAVGLGANLRNVEGVGSYIDTSS